MQTLETLAHATATYQKSFATLVKAVDKAGVKPALILNSVPYFRECDIENAVTKATRNGKA